MIVLFILLSSMHSPSFAAENPNPIFKPNIGAKERIEVASYDPQSQSYHVTAYHVPAEKSESYATPENLVKAIHSLSLEDIRRRPESAIGNIYTLDADLLLIDYRLIAKEPKFSGVRAEIKRNQSLRRKTQQ